MADLKSFAQPTNTTLYTDVVDTERGFHAAHAKLQHSEHANPPLGAINLDSPGGATRSLTQWNGTAYTNVILNSPGGYAAPTYSFSGLANCYVAANIGTGNPGFSFDANDFMDYERAANRWRIAVGGAEKLIVDNNAAYILQQTTFLQHFGTTYLYVANTASALDQKNWVSGWSDGEMQQFAQNDARTTNNVYDRISRSGLVITSRRLNETSGRLLVGQSVADDGVTALQTTSYSAGNQPSLVSGSGVSYSLAPNAGQILDVVSNTLKGGVTLTVSNTRIVVPVAGQYLLTGVVSFVSGASAGAAYLRILKNGTLYAFQGLTQVLGSRDYLLPVALQIPMLANDYISIEVVSNPNTNVSATVGLQNASFTKIN